MTRQKRRCKNCRSFFEACPKVKKHAYCKKEACQKARKKKWQKRKIADDQTYRQDQKEAQKIWLDKRPGYWKQYRASHPEYTQRNRKKQKDRNRSVKVHTAAKSSFREIAKMDALIVEIGVIKDDYKNFCS